MKKSILFLLLAFSSSIQGQEIVVDEILIMDESQQWPFTWDIAMDSDSTLYTGNELGKVYMKKLNEDWEEISVPDEDNNDVRKILVDVFGSLWIATDGGGLFRLKNDEWTNYTVENSNISSNSFRYLVTTNDGKIYAAGSTGLNIFSNNIWTVLNSSNSTLEKDDIDALEYNPTTNRVLVGDNGFFYVIQGTSIVKKEDLDSAFGWMTWVTSLHAHQDVVYIGTETGLYVFENNQVSSLTSIYDDKNVSDITVDSEGNLWLGEVFYGIHIYDGNTLHSLGSTDTIPNQIFDMMTFGDQVLTVGNRGARLAASHFENMTSSVTNSLLPNLKVFPTIVDQFLTIEDLIDNRAGLNCEVYNNMGQKIKELPYQKTMNFENFEGGIYYLVLKDQTGKQLYKPTKFIKK